MLKKRSRIITVRLSEEQYANLRQESAAHGAFSVSDYARLRLFSPDHDGSIESRIMELSSEMQELARRMDQLTLAIGVEAPHA